MNIYSKSFHRQLVLLRNYDSLKGLFASLVENRTRDLTYYMSKSKNPQHLQDFSVSQFSLTGVRLPQADTQELTPEQCYLEFKNEFLRFMKTLLPFSSCRLNNLSLSVRIEKSRLARAEKVLEAFTDDVYWNNYFRDQHPDLTSLIETFSQKKGSLLSNENDTIYTSHDTDEYVYYRLALPKSGIISFMTEEELNGGSIVEMFNRNGLESEMDERSTYFHRFANSSPFSYSFLSDFICYVQSVFFLDELYDFIKEDMESHYAQLHEQMQEGRVRNFERLVNWYKMTHVDEDNKTFKPLFTTPMSPLPEKIELFLYASKKDSSWKAHLIGPTSENPLLEDYSPPVIGNFTKLVNETGRITVNDYFDVDFDMEQARALWLEHTTIEQDLFEAGYVSSEQVNLDRYEEEEAPREEYVDSSPEPTKEEPVQKTITLEELFRQNGIELQQEPDEEETEPDVDDPYAEKPGRYRITKIGDVFNLYFSESDEEPDGILISNLNHAQLLNALRQYGLESNFPLIVRYDTSEERQRSLDRPYHNVNNYLLY